MWLIKVYNSLKNAISGKDCVEMLYVYRDDEKYIITKDLQENGQFCMCSWIGKNETNVGV